MLTSPRETRCRRKRERQRSVGLNSASLEIEGPGTFIGSLAGNGGWFRCLDHVDTLLLSSCIF